MRRTKAEIENQRSLEEAGTTSIAHQKTPEYKAQQAAEINQLCRKWRGVSEERPRGMFSPARAAQVLGIPKRTYENIEQGRGFPYPILLIHAIRSFD